MSIVWESPTTPGPSDVTNRYAGGGTTWGAGDIAFRKGFEQPPGEIIQSSLCRFVIDSVETTGFSIQAQGSGHWQGWLIYEYNPTWPGLDNGSHTWRLKVVTNANTYYSDLVTWTVYQAGTAPNKTTSPSPADSSIGHDFSDWTLEWEGGSGATSFSLYLGDSPYSLLLMGTTSNFTYVVPELSGFRNYSYYHPAYWRVDAVNTYGTTTGDVWSFDPRPAAVIAPWPENTATDVSTCPVLSWDASAVATSYTVYAGLPGGLISQTTGLTDTTYTVGDDIFDYITTYNWRIDAVNQFGTTTGTVWSFTSMRFDPPMYVSYYSATNTYWSPLIQANGTLGAGPDNGGTENTTFVYVAAPNNILTRKRLIVLANSKLWYET